MHDSKHKVTDAPFKVAVEAGKAYTAETTGDLFFCGCKHSLTKPLCDGSHTKF